MSTVMWALLCPCERNLFLHTAAYKTEWIKTVNYFGARKVPFGVFAPLEQVLLTCTRFFPPMKVICSNLHFENIVTLWATSVKNAHFPTHA